MECVSSFKGINNNWEKKANKKDLQNSEKRCTMDRFKGPFYMTVKSCRWDIN